MFFSSNSLSSDHIELERRLGNAIRSFASELRMVDIRQLNYLIRFGKYNNLQDIVNSAAELHINENSSITILGASLSHDRRHAGDVSFDFELVYNDIHLMYSLRLNVSKAAVEIRHISYKSDLRTPTLSEVTEAISASIRT